MDALRSAIDISGAFFKGGGHHGVSKINIVHGRIVTLVEVSLADLVHSTVTRLRVWIQNLIVSSSIATTTCTVDTRPKLDSALEDILVRLDTANVS